MIPCTSKCVYQSDGLCTLDSAAAVGQPALGRAPAYTSFRRTQRGSDRLTDIPGRDHRQTGRRLYGTCPMSRHHAPPESQALNFRHPLIQLIDAAQFPGQAHLSDGHQIAGTGLSK